MGGKSASKGSTNIWIAGVPLLVLVILGVLWKVGLIAALSSRFVNHKIDTMRDVEDRNANQPRTVIMKSGERIECKRVVDQSAYWGLLLKDGRTSAVKKADVSEILEP